MSPELLTAIRALPAAFLRSLYDETKNFHRQEEENSSNEVSAAYTMVTDISSLLDERNQHVQLIVKLALEKSILEDQLRHCEEQLNHCCG